MLSHYRLLEKIGAGGMGVIWKALDTNLGRHTALKVLPPELTADPDRRRRLMREARTAASVTHPNIATIYEVGEFEGTMYVSMELVQGRTLRSVIGGRPMTIGEALRVGTEIAEGLARAHEAGIVHRDLKPENIIVGADGRPRILDFGLAKLVEQRDVLRSQLSQQETRTEELTQEGTILGTPAYMSPEQIRGEDVDVRSDIFSFGVVLYEMVTGRLPFKGQSRFDTLAAILKEPAEAASGLNALVPAKLDEVLEKCLDKNAGARYQSCQDLVVDLKRLGKEIESGASRSYGGSPASSTIAVAARPATRRGMGGAAGALLLLIGAAVIWLVRSQRGLEPGANAGQPAAKVASIAVLPFVNMSGDRDNEYFSDGLAEELLNALAKNPALRVVARTSSFSFKGKDTDLAEIGRRLRVESVLEGSVRKAGKRVRITVQLVSATDGYHIWSETYDRQLEDIFAVQDDIARSVMTSLKATLPGAGAAAQCTGNTEAYNLVLKGNYFWARYGPGDLEKARDLYKQALALDPESACAWWRLGLTYGNMVERGELSREEGDRLSREANERALALDDSLAAAHATRGWDKMVDWDWAGAESDLGKAMALEPQNPAVLNLAAALAGAQGRLKEANEIHRRMHEIDPLSVWTYNNSTISLFNEGRLDE